ncbi:SLC13 family permease [Inquilinus sp. OTU3971]|uniref:SLC13 family permease n=1 Tax=Inquilinus sp. OTU3971 TaxID=3043855 RepID=UPI00313DA131
MTNATQWSGPAHGPRTDGTRWRLSMDAVRLRTVLVACGAALTGLAIEFAIPGMAPATRHALEILLLAMIGWTLTPLDDTFVAVAAAVAMTVFVTGRPEALFATLGNELIWLLLASFLLAAAFRATGAADRLVVLAATRLRSVRTLAYALTAIILATAFVVPSTSGRAAMMVPAYAAIARHCAGRQLRTAFALLFPTAILLSAFASPLGAGAHLLAIEMTERLSGTGVGYLGWVAFGLPFAALSAFLSTEAILRLFLTPEERSARLTLPSIEAERPPLRRQPVLWIAAAVVLGWLTEPMHGIDPTVLALLGALAAFCPGVGSLPFRDGLRDADLGLLLFLAATICLADGLMASGLHEWLVATVFRPLQRDELSPPTILALVAAIGLLSHLVIHSRTARVSILLPPMLILAHTAGISPITTMLATVSATGFCQTLMISAKPVALFGRLAEKGYGAGDLARLSAVLLPLHFLLIMLFAIVAWPALGSVLASP